ncbi:hypothetical protein Poli38472_005043 [Pythium oligandrum]|uniref:HECT domain-containing protein n=1 Tax=Pythium oligandrum TaxID=41045 RepID=A0A8K1CFU9_PYTOL|nr:hypothetical protein Poli38472_005043 [Pythium oligandrum]|eukprot:TMW62425.1 hypothetical protein Poli38472_005043 [Pythium oligandrum]
MWSTSYSTNTAPIMANSSIGVGGSDSAARDSGGGEMATPDARASSARNTRLTVYPPVPMDGPRLTLVLPRTGDLRLRPMLSNVFEQQLAIHCNAEYQHVYRKFMVVRKFLVMAVDGNLYTHHLRSILRLEHLPNGTLLPPPASMAPMDVVKVLDLVQCYTFDSVESRTVVPTVRWELVRVRWRSGRETWIPRELMDTQDPKLLQEFYVNSANSWAFRDRIFPESLSAYLTEAELWRHHPDFKRFVRQLELFQRQRATLEPATAPVPAPASTSASLASTMGSASSQLQRQSEPSPQAQHVPTATLDEDSMDQTYEPDEVLTSEVGSAVEGDRRKRMRKRRRTEDGTSQPDALELPQTTAVTIADDDDAKQRKQEKKQRKREEQLEKERLEQEQRLKEKKERRKQRKRERKEQERLERERIEKEHKEQAKREKKERKAKARREREERERQEKEEQEKTERKEREKRDRKERERKEREDEEKREKKERERKQRKKREKEEQIEQERREREEQERRDRAKREQKEREKEEREKSVQEKENKHTSHSVVDSAKSHKRKRRLKVSLVDSSEEDSEIEEILSSSQRHSQPIGSSVGTEKAKRFKRLRRPGSDDDDDDDDNVTLVEIASSQPSQLENSEAATEVVIDDGEDDDAGDVGELEIGGDEYDEDPDANSVVGLGEISCVCGAQGIDRYTGRWLRCCREDCDAWEHAECVGMLDEELEDFVTDSYVCSRCDPVAFRARYARARSRLVDWMFQCSQHKNQTQLLHLLTTEQSTSAASDWRCKSLQNRTLLMQVARDGLLRVVKTLLTDHHANVYGLDSHSRTVLHHAAFGESLAVARFLLAQYPALMTNADLSGVMPLHLMIRSPRLNELCVAMIETNRAISVTSDFDGNMPIHCACHVVNASTVAIVRMIMNFQPLAPFEQSPEGEWPLLLLCQAISKQLSSDPNADRTQHAAAAEHMLAIVRMLLEVDPLGSFLNVRDKRGWTAVHYIAYHGHHELLTRFMQLPCLEYDAITFDSGETALHLVARVNSASAVNALLVNDLADVMAVDAAGWIPILRATEPMCLREFLHYDLQSQLNKANTVAQRFGQREAIRKWLRQLLHDPTCFDIVNDWLQHHLAVMDEIDELARLNRSLVRVDNKLEYLARFVFPSVRARAPRTLQTKPFQITLDGGLGCCWQQFVSQTQDFAPDVFRSSIAHFRFVLTRGELLRVDNVLLVLVRLISGLVHADTGILDRNSNDTLEPRTHASITRRTLIEFCVLGQLVAYLVLNKVVISDVFEFSTTFLECVLYGKAGRNVSRSFVACALSFASGFGHVLPSTLSLLRVGELRLLLHGAETSGWNALQVNWASAVDWVGFGVDTTKMQSWWTRLLQELVPEERVLLLLFVNETFRQTRRSLFPSGDYEKDSPRMQIKMYRHHKDSEDGAQGGEDLPLPKAMDQTLTLPMYASYEAFHAAMLRAVRDMDIMARVM